MQQLAHRGWCWVDRQEGLLTGGDWRQAMVELKGRQPWKTEGELQCRSPLTLTAQGLVPCWNQMHIHIVESLQLEDSYGGDLLYLIYLPVVVGCQSITVI